MAHLIVDGTVFPVPDGDDFDFGELADMEEVAGAPLNTLPEKSARATIAVIYIAMRRVDPSITVAQVRALKPEQFDFVEDEPDPPPAVAEDGKPEPPPEDETFGVPS